MEPNSEVSSNPSRRSRPEERETPVKNGKSGSKGNQPAKQSEFVAIEGQNSFNLNRDQLLDLLYNLKRIRGFEDSLKKLHIQGRVRGGVYSGKGQEAISVGTCFGLRNDDIVSPIHRDIGVFLLKGMPMRRLMCQIMGRKSGPSTGRDSWSHTGDMQYNILASSSMLGSSVPILCGATLATQMQGRDSVGVTYFGEGSTARGDFHEGINMAAVSRLPVIFVCENNQWAYSTPLTREMGDTNIAKRASAYGMTGVVVDGNDVLAVYEITRAAIERARSAAGPTFIECRTYRMDGHSEADPAKYRPSEDLQRWIKRDPIGRYREWLQGHCKLTDDEERRMQERIDAEVVDARKFAETQPYPDAADALEGVFMP
jgi:TPP-dependent pyruvate/acetoin dehydrogenase alpha subunit